MGDLSGAERLLERLRTDHRQVVDLARLASVASVVEPALLRRLRMDVGLRSTDRPVRWDAGLEADLWFSGLVQVATVDQVVLRPDMLELLRGELGDAGRRGVAEAARRIVADAHRAHPALVQLEERIVWSTIVGDSDDVTDALRLAIATLRVESNTSQVVRWWSQARRRLPRSAIGHELARRLTAAVSVHADRTIPPELIAAGRFPAILGELAHVRLPQVAVGVRLGEGAVRFEAAGESNAATIEIPDTRPRMVELTWDRSGQGEQAILVEAEEGQVATLQGMAGSAVLRTFDGTRYRIGIVTRPSILPPPVDPREALSALAGGFDEDDELVLEALRPYVVNLSRGQFATDGIMTTTPQDVDAIFDEYLPAFLRHRAASTPVPVVLWAHGGMVSERAGLRIAAGQVPWWVDNGAYPIHFAWQTEFSDTLRSLSSLIRTAQPIGGRRAPWWVLKQDARAASAPSGGAHYLAERLSRFCRQQAGRIRVHAVAHSAGAEFLSRFVPTSVDLGVPGFATVQLLAPTLRVDDFESTLLPMIGKGVDRLTVYAMKAEAEREDSSFRVYRRSLLYLISEMFEEPPDAPLLGLEESIRGSGRLQGVFGLDPDRSPAADLVLSPTEPDAPPGSRSTALTHGGFDNDFDTMMSVGARVLGSDLVSSFPGSMRSATLSEDYPQP